MVADDPEFKRRFSDSLGVVHAVFRAHITVCEVDPDGGFNAESIRYEIVDLRPVADETLVTCIPCAAKTFR